MSQDDFRKRAADALDQAMLATNLNERSRFLTAAAGWQAKADELEQGAKPLGDVALPVRLTDQEPNR